MDVLSFLLLAFAPGIFWLWFFVRKDIYRPEPKRLLALTFFLGMVSTIPAGVVNAIFLDDSIVSGPAAAFTMGMLFVVGPVEETAKFLAVRLVAFRSLYFDEPGDGLVYSVAASLGFASLENFMYIINFGPEVMIGRAPLSTLAHAIFGSFWGYALGSQKQEDTRNSTPVFMGVATGAVVHGLFNVLVMTPQTLLAAVVLIVLGAWWTLRHLDWAQRVSPFRYKRNYPRILCLTCNQRINVLSRFCRFCGAPVMTSRADIYCSHCNTRNLSHTSFCTGCGDQLMR